jgi:hypothetical protein
VRLIAKLTEHKPDGSDVKDLARGPTALSGPALYAQKLF